MKERILKLSKRLNKFMLDEISLIAEDIEESVLIPILEELVQEQKLIKRGDLYLYNKKITANRQISKVPIFFQYYDKSTAELILKCFCAEIPVLKVALIIEPSKTAILNFYNYFRKCLYETQLNKLKKHYDKTPKIPSIRTLYDKKIYFYNYNNEIFLTDKPLQSTNPEKRHLKDEMRDMNVAYYRIRRVFQNYAFTQRLAEIAYEKLWMQEKSQETKIKKLTDLLFS